MLRRLLTRKITRERLHAFLQSHATDSLVMDIGSSANTLHAYFPHTLRGDIRFIADIDVQYDAHALPFASNSVSLILCTEVLEHCYDPQKVISEFHRILRADGKLILTTRFVFPLHDTPHDYFRFTIYGLQHLCRQFSEVTITSEAGTAETMGVLFQRLIYQIEWKVPLIKVLWSLLARLFVRLQPLIRREYGDIGRETPVTSIMTSGYYVVAIR